MSYITDITTLMPDHLWTLDGIYTDEIGSAVGTNSGGIMTESGICIDATNCWSSNTIAGDRIDLGDVSDISNALHTNKAVGGWFETSKIQPHPCRIYGEGGTNPTFQFILAMGNNTMFECVDTDGIAQTFGIALVPNRSYHILGRIASGTMEFFIDGISQGTNTGYGTTLSERTSAEFADPASTVGVGNANVLLQAPVNGRYNYWATWEGTNPTDTVIREELFEKGAIPDNTITNQAELTALNNSTRDNSPLNILVDYPGDISLDATNIIFDDLASIHIQYNGTGTLTWNNIGTSNATIFSTTNGGSILTPTHITVSVNVKNAKTLENIENARVYIKEANGEDILNDLTDSDGNVSSSYIHTSDKNIIGVVRKASGDFYKTSQINTTVKANNLLLNILLVADD